MGKQVNYYMNYEGFLELAQTALESGCLIVKGVHTDEIPRPAANLSGVTKDCNLYYFYLPELADLDYGTDRFGKYFLNYNFNRLGIAVIEAGFSLHPADRARLYIMTGYYDPVGEWISCSERITKVYEKLARKAKKIAQRLV